MQRELAASYVYALVDYMGEHNMLTPEVLAHPVFARVSEIQEAFDNNVMLALPIEDLTDMLDQVAVLKGAGFFGVDVAKRVTAAHLGVLGYVLLACPHLGAALNRLEKYARLLDRSFFMEITGDEKYITFSWPLMIREVYHPLFAEMGIATFVQYARNLTGKDLPLQSVSFCHEPIVDVSRYTEFFGCPVQFNQPEAFMSFEINHLNTPLRQPDERLLTILENQAMQALAQIPNQQQFLQQVHAIMLTLCRETLPTLDEVASRLNMSARTLQRKLSDHGFTFQQLLEQTQQHLAEQYLKDERLQLVEIAQLLGYSDQSAFTRAFKRWTGNTPKAYRVSLMAS